MCVCVCVCQLVPERNFLVLVPTKLSNLGQKRGRAFFSQRSLSLGSTRSHPVLDGLVERAGAEGAQSSGIMFALLLLNEAGVEHLRVLSSALPSVPLPFRSFALPHSSPLASINPLCGCLRDPWCAKGSSVV